MNIYSLLDLVIVANAHAASMINVYLCPYQATVCVGGQYIFFLIYIDNWLSSIIQFTFSSVTDDVPLL